MTRYSLRHIALHVSYLGWAYHGVAVQDGGIDTVEGRLFDALLKTKLISDPKDCGFSRSGRTDKGVSAFEQVMSLTVRSSATATMVAAGGLEDGFVRPAPVKKDAEAELMVPDEIDFPFVLNRVLPEDIRVVAWAAVPVNFDARFSTLYRTYRYYFCDHDGPAVLNLDRMREAAQHFVGEHDFSNFCKADVGAVHTHMRTVVAIDVKPLSDVAVPHRGRMCELRVRGFAFLWHQVRNMAAVLFAVGDGSEEPDIVRELLDVEKNPGKPLYDMASDIPLVLHKAAYDAIEWRYGSGVAAVARTMLDQAHLLALRLAVVDGFIESLPRSAVEEAMQIPSSHNQRKTKKGYIPLLERPTEASFQEKVDNLERKTRAKEAKAAEGAEEEQASKKQKRQV